MADDPKDPKAGAPEGGQSLKEQIKAALAEMGIGKKDDDDPPGDVASQVAAAVKQVREGDAAAKEREKTEARLAALEAAKKTPEPEKTPRENRWIERVMGWVTDDE